MQCLVSATNVQKKTLFSSPKTTLSAAMDGSRIFSKGEGGFSKNPKSLTRDFTFCFGARSPSKLVYSGAKGACRKILGSVGKNGFLE